MPRLYRAARPDEVATLAGVPAAPPNVRLARSKAALVERGGRRVTINLSPEAAAALAQIRKLLNYPNDTLVIEMALVRQARAARRSSDLVPMKKKAKEARRP